jgi:hypothetical protein
VGGATPKRCGFGILDTHILPELGEMRMIDIFPEPIREWIALMQKKNDD